MNDLIHVLNVTGEGFVNFAYNMLIQSSFLILLLYGLDLLLRRHVRAVVRYWIWCLILLKLMMPTSLSSSVSILQWFRSSQPIVVTVPPTTPPPLEIIPPTLEHVESGSASVPTTLPPIQDTGISIPPLSPGPATAVLAWPAYVLLAWAAAIIALSAILIQRACFVRRLVRQSQPATKEMIGPFSLCQKKMPCFPKARLRITTVTTSPSVCGFLRPVVLIPQSMTHELTRTQMESIFLHELAHIQRGDLVLNLLQTLLQIIYAYHPLLWWANAKIRLTREEAVDETVLATLGSEAETYPQTLLQVSKLVFKHPAMSLRLLGVAESPKLLTQRILHMAGRPFPTHAGLGTLSIISILCLGGLLLPLVSAAQSEQPTDSVQPTASLAVPVKDTPRTDPNELNHLTQSLRLLKDQREQLKKSMDLTRQEIRNYVSQHGTLAIPHDREMLFRRSMTLHERLSTIEEKRIQAEIKVSLLSQLADPNHSTPIDASALLQYINNDPQVKKLTERILTLKEELTVAEQTLAPSHLSIQKKKDELEIYQVQLAASREERRKEFDTLHRQQDHANRAHQLAAAQMERDLLVTEEDRLKEMLRTQDKQLQELNRKSLESQDKKLQLSLDKEMYDALSRRIREVEQDIREYDKLSKQSIHSSDPLIDELKRKKGQLLAEIIELRQYVTENNPELLHKKKLLEAFESEINKAQANLVSLLDLKNKPPMNLPLIPIRQEGTNRFTIDPQYRDMEITRIDILISVQEIHPQRVPMIDAQGHFITGQELSPLRLIWTLKADTPVPAKEFELVPGFIPPGFQQIRPANPKAFTPQKGQNYYILVHLGPIDTQTFIMGHKWARVEPTVPSEN